MDVQVCSQEFIDLAHRLAAAGGAVVQRYFRTVVTIDDKADESPVTIADRDAEAAMRQLLNAAMPDHGIIGEEHGRERADADFVWVLDPIDGTKSFITGKPVFGTLVALLYQGRPILGIIDQPINGERWVGAVGHPTTFNGEVVRTRACGQLSAAILGTTDPDFFLDDDGLAFDALSAQVKMRSLGADCYAYGLLASGFLDLVCESQLQLYDYAALVPVVEGAGGVMTDWSGEPLHKMTGDQRVLASGNAALHAKALSVLAG